MRTNLLAVAGLVVVLAAPVHAAEKARPGVQTRASVELTVGKGPDAAKVTMRYWVFLPADYEKSEKPCPMLLFLHGMGERGDDLEKVKKHGPPKIVDKKPDFPFVLVSPQCPDTHWWRVEELIALVDYAAGTYRVDPDRIYVTGLSMGGFGTWALIAKYPDRFAAAVPICGGGKEKTAKRLVDLPIWAFHGGRDRIVKPERSKAMVRAIEAAGGKKVKLTIYPEAGHNSWSEAYNNQELYRWLLSQKRPAKQ